MEYRSKTQIDLSQVQLSQNTALICIPAQMAALLTTDNTMLGGFKRDRHFLLLLNISVSNMNNAHLATTIPA